MPLVPVTTIVNVWFGVLCVCSFFQCVFVFVPQAKCVKRIDLKCAQYEGCACSVPEHYRLNAPVYWVAFIVYAMRKFFVWTRMNVVSSMSSLSFPSYVTHVPRYESDGFLNAYRFCMHSPNIFYVILLVFAVIIPLHTRCIASNSVAFIFWGVFTAIFLATKCVILFTLMTLWQWYK